MGLDSIVGTARPAELRRRERCDAFTVIPLESLHSAFVDPAMRYQGEEWGIGFTCVFTYSGLAVRRGGAWQ